MTSKASAPGKVILLGEHFVVYGKKAILASIDKRVKVTSEKKSEKIISVKSNIGQLIKPVTESIEKINSPLKPFFYIAKKMIKKFNFDGGISIVVESEIPLGVGLGSSSACCVAGAASISNLFTKLSREDIIELAIKAEQTIFKDTSGADCTVCTHGGIIEYNKQNGFKKINSENNLTLVIANSKQIHSTSVTVSKVKKYKERNEEKFSRLCEKEEMLVENFKNALSKNDFKLIGKNMTENQNYLEEIGISNDTIREMIVLVKNSAYGAKITGAGDGGCIIALVDETNIDSTLKNLQNKKYECFSVKIDSKGLDTF